jgi:hypothetical protein
MNRLQHPLLAGPTGSGQSSSVPSFSTGSTRLRLVTSSRSRVLHASAPSDRWLPRSSCSIAAGEIEKLVRAGVIETAVIQTGPGKEDKKEFSRLVRQLREHWGSVPNANTPLAYEHATAFA